MTLCQGHHGEVGDANDLTAPSQPAEALSNRLCHGSADPGIYFIEDQQINAVERIQRHLEGEHDARELAARGDALERAAGLARIGGETQLDLVDPPRTRPIARRRLDDELEARARQAERG